MLLGATRLETNYSVLRSSCAIKMVSNWENLGNVFRRSIADIGTYPVFSDSISGLRGETEHGQGFTQILDGHLHLGRIYDQDRHGGLYHGPRGTGPRQAR